MFMLLATQTEVLDRYVRGWSTCISSPMRAPSRAGNGLTQSYCWDKPSPTKAISVRCNPAVRAFILFYFFVREALQSEVAPKVDEMNVCDRGRERVGWVV
jgi:hypothetical protein